jgi:hypothetical protein
MDTTTIRKALAESQQGKCPYCRRDLRLAEVRLSSRGKTKGQPVEGNDGDRWRLNDLIAKHGGRKTAEDWASADRLHLMHPICGQLFQEGR